MYLPFFIQIPFWIASSVAIRNLATAQVAFTQEDLLQAKVRVLELANGGFGWVTDLTMPDKTWIVPLSIGLAYLANLELTNSRVSKDLLTQGGAKPLKKSHVAFTYFLRGIAIIIVPISANVPAALALYWSVSAYAGLAVNLVMMSPKVRKAVRIPATALDSQNPYKTAWQNFQTNLKSSFKRKK